MVSNTSSAIDQYFEFVEEHFDLLPIAEEEDFLGEYGDLEPIIRNVLLVNYFVGCLLNGGLKQFFARDVGVSAPELSVAFEESAEFEMKLLLDAAIARFGDVYPRRSVDRIKKIQILEDQSDEKFAFETQDTQMYECVGFNADRLIERQWNYIYKNILENKSEV